MNIKKITIHIPSTENKRNNYNPLTQSVRSNLFAQLQDISQKNDSTTPIPTILVLTSSPHFSVGMDINEFSNSTMIEPTLEDICNIVTSMPSSIITIALINGMAFGGGTELALCCDYILASPTAKFSLPEVKIGVFPGGGGTQRLPRFIGIEQSLGIICTGRVVSVKEALTLGIIQDVLNDNCIENWIKEYTAQKPLQKRELSKISLPKEKVIKACEVFRRKLPPREKGGDAVHAAVTALSSCHLPLAEGLAFEKQLFFDILVNSLQGKAKRHLFFAQRRAAKPVPGKISSNPTPKASKKMTVGVVGGGTMGIGIALAFLQKKFAQVILVDVNEKAVVQAKKRMEKSLASKKGLSHLIQNLTTSTSLASLSNCNLIIEAVFERLDIKKEIVSNLNSIASDSCFVVSNTSTLSVSDIFKSYKNPNKTCGMHFFSPAHVMPLVEIVQSVDSSISTIRYIQGIVKLLSKVGVVVKDADGFVGNRMIANYSSESVFLLEEGCSVMQVDSALIKFGMKIGPFSMSDLAGNDIGFYIRQAKDWTGNNITTEMIQKRPQRYSELADDLVKILKRLGQKTNKGWYDYDPSKKKRVPIPSQEVSQFISKYQSTYKIASKEDIIQRVLFPLVNEGFKILDEDLASNPGDIDIVYIYGYGFPDYKGGPMFWADHEVGLPYVLQKLYKYHAEYPGGDYFKPSELLKRCVEAGVGIQEYYDKGLMNRGNVSSNSKL